MFPYQKKIDIRWSDIDANAHLRHSVYYDLGTSVRISFLTEHGLSPHSMQLQKIGPIMFREECVFKREILFKDVVTVNVQLKKCSKDMSRWTMVHEVTKEDGILCAVITIDGAWMNTELPKLTLPPASFIQVFEQIPKTTDFEWIIMGS